MHPRLRRFLVLAILAGVYLTAYKLKLLGWPFK